MTEIKKRNVSENVIEVDRGIENVTNVTRNVTSETKTAKNENQNSSEMAKLKSKKNQSTVNINPICH